jgi:ThiF family protein
MAMFTPWKTKRRLTMAMTRGVYNDIRNTIGARPAETGGMLGGDIKDGVARHFHYDAAGRTSSAIYTPDIASLNALLSNEWNPAGVRLLGFCHAHPPGCRRPSGGDIVYAKRILDHNPDLERLLLPIVMSAADGAFELLPYSAVRTGNRVAIEAMALTIVDGDEATPLEEEARATTGVMPAVTFSQADGAISLEETFRRVRTAYDLRQHASSRVIYVGLGGGAGFAEDLARAGVAEHVLIDADTVSATNLATQQTYRKDVRRPKVSCVAERILDINPHAAVVARQQRLDEIDDAEFRHLAFAPLREWEAEGHGAWGIPDFSVPVQVAVRPAVTLLCGLTDNFWAQARVNRLALHFGLPSLCAQVYREGRAAEVTFTHPMTTPACHRCALRSRFEAFENGVVSSVTSDGTPIFATTRLNALKGFLALALLHHGTEHPRWGKLLERIGNRNLVQIRMHPDCDLAVFTRVFGGGDQRLFDDAAWLPQKPDCPANGFPPCPDCGGSGSLRDAVGTFADTCVMRTANTNGDS